MPGVIGSTGCDQVYQETVDLAEGEGNEAGIGPGDTNQVLVERPSVVGQVGGVGIFESCP